MPNDYLDQFLDELSKNEYGIIADEDYPSLIEKARGGDKESRDRIILSFLRVIMSVIFKGKYFKKSYTWDLINEGILIVNNCIDNFKGKSFFGYVYGKLRGKFWYYVKKEKQYQGKLLEGDTIWRIGNPTEEFFKKAEVSKLVNYLPEGDLKDIIKFRLEGRTLCEISKIMGVSKNKIWLDEKKAKSLMKEAYKEDKNRAASGNRKNKKNDVVLSIDPSFNAKNNGYLLAEGNRIVDMGLLTSCPLKKNLDLEGDPLKIHLLDGSIEEFLSNLPGIPKIFLIEGQYFNRSDKYSFDDIRKLNFSYTLWVENFIQFSLDHWRTNPKVFTIKSNWVKSLLGKSGMKLVDMLSYCDEFSGVELDKCAEHAISAAGMWLYVKDKTYSFKYWENLV